MVRNVADLADAPTTSRNSRTMSVWTSDELRAFLDAISDHYLYPLYLPAATTGMRRAEIAGLVWRNVDLDTARLTVSQQLLSVEYKLIESDLKTPTSRRTIDLDPHTVTQLRLHRRRQLEDRMATGRRHKDGYVFAKPDGSPIHPDLISQSTPKSSANASATPASPSPWTSTNTSYPACKPKPPPPSEPPSSATADNLRAIVVVC